MSERHLKKLTQNTTGNDVSSKRGHNSNRMYGLVVKKHYSELFDTVVS